MDDAATQSLVVSLEVVVLHVLFDEQAKVLLPERDDFVQALGLDGQDETHHEGVQIRTARRQSDRSRTAILEHMSETGRVQRVSVHDVMRYPTPCKMPSKGSVRLRAPTGHLLHPCFTRLSRNANDLHLLRSSGVSRTERGSERYLQL